MREPPRQRSVEMPKPVRAHAPRVEHCVEGSRYAHVRSSSSRYATFAQEYAFTSRFAVASPSRWCAWSNARRPCRSRVSARLTADTRGRRRAERPTSHWRLGTNSALRRAAHREALHEIDRRLPQRADRTFHIERVAERDRGRRQVQRYRRGDAGFRTSGPVSRQDDRRTPLVHSSEPAPPKRRSRSHFSVNNIRSIRPRFARSTASRFCSGYSVSRLIP